MGIWPLGGHGHRLGKSHVDRSQGYRLGNLNKPFAGEFKERQKMHDHHREPATLGQRLFKEFSELNKFRRLQLAQNL